MSNHKKVFEFKKRRHARKLVTSALKKGNLVKATTCELCAASTALEAHHVDYGRPLAVRWLCKLCHSDAHTKNHALNPDNNPQTPNIYLNECKDLIQVTVLLPLENFIVIHEMAEFKKVSVSKLLKERIIKDYPAKQDQLEFNFEAKKNDDSRKKLDARVSDMETLKGDMHKFPMRNSTKLQEEKIYDEKNMDFGFLPILSRDRGSTRRL